MEPDASSAQTCGPEIIDGLLVGADEFVSQWIMDHLDADAPADPLIAVGSVVDGELVGGVLYHEWIPEHMVSMIAAGRPGWLSRLKLKKFFSYAFDELGCNRINAAIAKKNKRSRTFARKLGFKEDGCLRKALRNGDDVMVLGMLKDDCRWI